MAGEIAAAMDGLGYHYYRLGLDVALEPSDRVVGQRRSKHQVGCSRPLL